MVEKIPAPTIAATPIAVRSSVPRVFLSLPAFLSASARMVARGFFRNKASRFPFGIKKGSFWLQKNLFFVAEGGAVPLLFLLLFSSCNALIAKKSPLEEGGNFSIAFLFRAAP